MEVALLDDPRSILSVFSELRKDLRCPVCGSPFLDGHSTFRCANDTCETSYPVVDGVPVLINEARSVFSIEDFMEGRPTYFRSRPQILQIGLRVLPKLGFNLKSRRNYARLVSLLLEDTEMPRVLVIGGGITGKGMEPLIQSNAIRVVNCDVALTDQVAIICDAHDLPFANEAFDAVVAQAVLEHVIDPYRCVDEIHRVLKPRGIVYAETPFMQQVHGGKYDFTRFTFLGYRRLFRHFDQVAIGAAGGPATVLAWSYEYLLLSLVRSRIARAVVAGFARLTGFWLKYLDLYLIDRIGTLDAAWGYYFLGRKSKSVLSDRALLSMYWRQR